MNTTAEAEPETTPEPEGGDIMGTLFPEVMGNQQAFLMYGIYIFALFVFCVVLLVLYLRLNKKFKKFSIDSKSQIRMRASTGKVDPNGTATSVK